MQSVEIREKFLKFFEKQGHTRVKSSSLIPAADPTLLFTAAGMVQFKDNFLGLHDAGYTRATTCQKCVRAGGKHNDLENVGFTPRHHTFFEMLGNFSFGDYFKKDAIAFAWELLTREFKLPKDRLRITIYKDDDEAFDLWKAQGVNPNWIVRLGEKDNFWAAGDTGPCGPCTEIYYDMGEKYCAKPDCNPGCSCDTRFLEIWNLVFMQFNRDTSGKLTPLPKPSVDTGGGLERWAAVLQGKFSNYDTDIFQPIIQAIGARVGQAYGAKESSDVSMRVIADHLRSGTFLMADGVIPSNEGRGYVLRRILRRAIRHGKQLGQDSPFLFELVSAVVKGLGAIYPELPKQEKLIVTLMREEEERFHETLHRGIGLLEESIAKTKKAGQQTISGEVAFKLYDSFGFPLDLIEVITREQNLGVDLATFNQLMDKQRSLSTFNKANDGAAMEQIGNKLKTYAPTNFKGYETLAHSIAPGFLFKTDGTSVDKLKEGEEGFAVFPETPFYAESGGQVGDQGKVFSASASADVLTTFKHQKHFLHRLKVTKGALAIGEKYELAVDTTNRKRTAINHTATHMLHAALRNVLGDRVKQAGSLVDPERLRFDFTYPRGLQSDEKQKIEAMVNAEVRQNLPVETKEMPYDDAIKSGAMAFFDEKYGETVRTVRVGTDKPFSVELCGGTHLQNISDIGVVKILSESSVASGVRRIEAITGDTALRFLAERDQTLESIEGKFGVKGDAVLSRIEALQNEIKELKQKNLNLQMNAGSGNNLWDAAKTINGYNVVYEHKEALNAEVMRKLVDQARDKLKENAVVCLSTSDETGKVSLCVGLTKDIVGKLNAGNLVKALTKEIGGTGGGRPDFAQGGAPNKSALDKLRPKLEEELSKA